MSKKDLLRCESSMDPRELAIQKLLNPKPRFHLEQSSLLSKIQSFLPEIKKANEMLKDETILTQLKIDDQNALTRTKVKDLIPNANVRKYIKRTGKAKTSKVINMDLYLGVLDTNGQVQEEQ